MFTGLALSVVAALASATLGGMADYVGGRLTRHRASMVVVAYSQAWSLLLLLIAMTLGMGAQRWSWSGWGVLAGILAVIGLGVFYLALSEGNMASVAPIATFGAVIPFFWGILEGERPEPFALVTLLAAVVGLFFSVYVGGKATRRQVLLSAAAAVTFGSTTVAIGRAYAEAGLAGLIVSKIVIVGVAVAILLVSRVREFPDKRGHIGLVGLAACDAGGNVLFGVSLAIGYLSIAGVVSSFYPAMTVLLAWRLDGERLARLQVFGLAILFGAIAVMVGV